MATSPNADARLPLYYNSLVPLSSQVHGKFGLTPREGHAFASAVHAIPLTVDEFALAHRHYPIVFGVGEDPAPLALVGLADGQNLFLNEKGEWQANTYIPAYVRRYPFMLAKLTPDAQQLSLVFDDTSGQIAEGSGDPLFDGDQPSELTKNILSFCEQFEMSIARTRQFMDELKKLNLLMDAEVTVQNPAMDKPAVFRGFRMVNEEKLRELRGDQSRKLVQSGMMGLVYAHMLSLSLIGELFGRASLEQAEAAAA